MTWKPWTFFAVALAGWMNRQQQEVIEYRTVENRILREKLGHKSIILNDSQNRRLAPRAEGRRPFRHCPVCDHTLLGGVKYCSDCGSKVLSRVAVPDEPVKV